MGIFCHLYSIRISHRLRACRFHTATEAFFAIVRSSWFLQICTESLAFFVAIVGTSQISCFLAHSRHMFDIRSFPRVHGTMNIFITLILSIRKVMSANAMDWYEKKSWNIKKMLVFLDIVLFQRMVTGLRSIRTANLQCSQKNSNIQSLGRMCDTYWVIVNVKIRATCVCVYVCLIAPCWQPNAMNRSRFSHVFNFNQLEWIRDEFSYTRDRILFTRVSHLFPY